MCRRFSSSIVLGSVLVLVSGHGFTSKLSAQSRLCPADVRTLTRPADDKLGRSPADQLKALLGEGFQGTIQIPSTITVEMGRTRFLTIGPCVTLKGTRGGLDPGALITATGRDADGPLFFVAGPRYASKACAFEGR